MPLPDPVPSDAVRSTQDAFIVEWGRMSSSWGINRTMAQIHALLLVTGHAYSMDEIIDRLHISRGNASMNLRDLLDWGLIQRTRRPGDRKDLYQSHADVIHVFARVVRERKRREIDPTVTAIRECLAQVPAENASEEATLLRDRLSALLEVFSVVDRVYQQVFESDEAFRQMLKLFREQGLIAKS
jgi:DNA-binding transcriptional regulator GbsR (MarR family)